MTGHRPSQRERAIGILGLPTKHVVAHVLVVTFLLVLLGPAPVSARPDLSVPWPDGTATDAVEGKRIEFPSHSPFSLADVGAGEDDDPSTTAIGTLFMPKSATAESPVPGVVLLHGAGGVRHARELTYGRQFAAMGVAALVVDAFAARRDRATRFIERLMEITEAMMLADAYAGLRYLGSRSGVDPDRIALIGFSYGGMATTYAAYAQVAELYSARGERFVGHAAFYAPCIANFDDHRSTGAPLLMLYGGKDAIVDPDRCAGVADELRRGGARVETIVYPEAHHQWDGGFAGPRKIGRNLAGCRLIVRRDATIRDRLSFIPMIDPLTRKVILGLCADDEGYLIGRNDEVRARSNQDLGRFLESVFAERGDG